MEKENCDHVRKDNSTRSSYYKYNLSLPEMLVYDLLISNELEFYDVSEISRNVNMSPLQVKAAMFLLSHKGLIKSEEIIDVE